MMHKAVCTLIVFVFCSSVASVDSSVNTCIIDNTKRSQPVNDQTSLIQKHSVVKMSTEKTAKEKPRAKPHSYQVGMQVEVRRSDNSWSAGTISAVTPDEVVVDVGGGTTRKVQVGDLDNLEMIRPLASRPAESTPAKVRVGFPQGVEELFKGRAMYGNYGEHMGVDGAGRQVGFIMVPFGGGVRNTGLIVRDYKGLTRERGFGDFMQYIYTDGLAGCLCLCLTGQHSDTGHMDVFFAHSPAWEPATDEIWNQANVFTASHSRVKVFWGTGQTGTMGYEETAVHIYGVLSDSIPGMEIADLQGDNSRWGMPNLAFDFVHDELVPITEGGHSPVTITIDNSGADPVFLVPNPKMSKASAEGALHAQSCSLGSCSSIFCSGLRKNQKAIINTLQTCTQEGGRCCGSSGGMMKALRCINLSGTALPMVFKGMPASITGAMSRADFAQAIAQTGTKEAAGKFYDWLSYECPVPQDVAVPGLTRLPNVEGETQKYGT